MQLQIFGNERSLFKIIFFVVTVDFVNLCIQEDDKTGNTATQD